MAQRYPVGVRPSPLALAVVLAGCGVDVDETVLAEAEGVKLVDRHRHGTTLACAGGHGFGICFPESVDRHHVAVVFEDRERGTACPHDADAFTLAWDETKSRLVVGCDDSWRVVFVAGDSYAGTLALADDFEVSPESWRTIPPLEEAAAELWGRLGSEGLLQALAAEHGNEFAADFIVGRCAQSADIRWDSHLGRLDPVVASRVHAGLRTAILEGQEDGDFMQCMAVLASEDRAPLTQTQLEAAQRRLADDGPPPLQARWLLWEARRTSAGPTAACSWIGAQEPGSWTAQDGHATTLAMLAVLDGDQACPAVARLVDPPCDPGFVTTTDGQPAAFDPQKHRFIIDAIAEKMAPYRSDDGPVVFTVVHQALRTRSDLDEGGTTRLARLHYETNIVEGCDVMAVRVAACEADATAKHASTDECQVQIDDTAMLLNATTTPE